MSQRVKRPNRSEDGSVPVKRRKRPAAEEEEAASLAVAAASTSTSSSWQPRSTNDNRIYNRTTTEAPAELFRKDLISAMKLPDSEPLSSDEYWIINDQWKQEWERGVQVPVNPDSLPEPIVTIHRNPRKILHDFKLPKSKYIRITKDENFKVEDHVLSNAPTQAEDACSYDLDECDTCWLRILNAERAACGLRPVHEDQLERAIERFEMRCWDKIQTILRDEEGLGIEFDENVICDVCRSPDSEEGNEMVFCDSCNICVHQACYGITRIPEGQWLCCTCNLSKRPKCVLCPNKGGAMKCTRSGQKWAHVSCALWIPEVSIGCVEKMEPITKISSIPPSRWALICVLCRERVGACIQCSVKTCKTAYHVTCAFKHGLEMRAIIEDENADDGVKLRSYCEKHSKSSKKEKSICSGSEDDDSRRRKRKDMTSEEKNQARAARLQEIEAEFYNHVSIKDVGVHLNIDDEALNHIYFYWKLKRKAGNNKPLLPPKTEDVDMMSHKREQADKEKLKMFVQLRQDLERVRNLCYMVSRREKLSRTYFRMREQTFLKQTAVLECGTNLPSAVINAVVEANHGPSIYDRLYSHDQAADHTKDFDVLIARIAGLKSPNGSGDEKKPETNGLLKSVKNNPYKKVYVNGSRRRSESLYSSLSSSTSLSSGEEATKVNDGDKSKKKVKSKRTPPSSSSIKRRKSNSTVSGGIIKLESSSEDDRGDFKKSWNPSSYTRSKLSQIEHELGISGTDSDDLMDMKRTPNQNAKMSSIYSDTDDSSDSMKEANANNSDSQQRLRTKASVKEFSQKPSSSKTNKTSTENKKKQTPTSTAKRVDKKKKDYPTDLIVPQRQAAKKATENLKGTTSARTKENPPPTTEETVKIEDKSEKKVQRQRVKSRDNKNEEPPEQDEKIENPELLAYVPQRQAAKKAAEHIKSGLGKTTAAASSAPPPVEAPPNSALSEPDKPKKDETVAPPPAKMSKTKPAKITEVKRISSSNSSSSSSSSSSSCTSSTSSSSSDEEEPPPPPSKTTSVASSRSEPAKRVAPGPDRPFLDKGPEQSVSATVTPQPTSPRRQDGHTAEPDGGKKSIVTSPTPPSPPPARAKFHAADETGGSPDPRQVRDSPLGPGDQPVAVVLEGRHRRPSDRTGEQQADVDKNVIPPSVEKKDQNVLKDGLDEKTNSIANEHSNSNETKPFVQIVDESTPCKNKTKTSHFNHDAEEAARSIFSPQPHKELLEIDNFDEGFTFAKAEEVFKLTFNPGVALNSKDDTREENVRETLNLVEKLRMGLSKKPTGCEVDDALSISSNSKNDDRSEFLEQVVPTNPPVDKSKEPKKEYRFTNDDGQNEKTIEQQHLAASSALTTQGDERWVPPSDHHQPYNLPNSFSFMAEYPPPNPEFNLFNAEELSKTHNNQSLLPDLHQANNAAYPDLRLHHQMHHRRSSSSSAASSIKNDHDDDGQQSKMSVQVTGAQPPPPNVDIGLFPLQSIPPFEPFAAFSEASPFVNPVSLFAGPNLNTQLAFPAAGPAGFPPAFGAPFPAPHILPPLPKQPEEAVVQFPPCTAAFTSSQHNMALTAAMVNVPTIPETPAPLEDDQPEQIEPTPCKETPKAAALKKPTRSSPRVTAAAKSPGKSPRQEPPPPPANRKKDSKKSGGKNANKVGQCKGKGGRGRGRGRPAPPTTPHLDYDMIGNSNTIQKLVGTVYDLDFDDEWSDAGDLKSMRERRKSTDSHDKKMPDNNVHHAKLQQQQHHESASPKLSSPSQQAHKKSYNLTDLRPPTPIDDHPKSDKANLENKFQDIVPPFLPGPVDMRTYNSYDEQKYESTNLLQAFAAGTTENRAHEEIDEEYEKEFHAALMGQEKEEKTSEICSTPVVAPSSSSAPASEVGIKVSLSDSRNQLKVKIKGPIANYATSQTTPTAVPPAANAANSTSTSSSGAANISSGSGTSNLRRMRKKELLRQYWSQDMSMDDPASAPMTPAPPVNRTIITIPRAVTSVTSIPTKDDYRDYRTSNDDFSNDNKQHKRETKARSTLSRELRQLDVRPSPTDASTESNKRRGRPPRAAAAATAAPSNAAPNNDQQPQPLITPKLKIKIGGNMASSRFDDKKDKIRPPKKRLSNIPMPSVEDLRRESMKFRKMVMASGFGEEKRKRKDKSEKRKKKRRQQKVEIVKNETENPTKLIIRINKKTDVVSDKSSGGGCVHDLLAVETCDSAPGKLMTPIKLKLSRCQAGSGYVMKDNTGGAVAEGGGAQDGKAQPGQPPPLSIPTPPPSAELKDVAASTPKTDDR